MVATVRATAAKRVRSELGLPVIRRSAKPHVTSRNQIAIPSKKSISSFPCIAKSRNENGGLRAYFCVWQSGLRLITVVSLASASEFNFFSISVSVIDTLVDYSSLRSICFRSWIVYGPALGFKVSCQQELRTVNLISDIFTNRCHQWFDLKYLGVL